MNNKKSISIVVGLVLVLLIGGVVIAKVLKPKPAQEAGKTVTETKPEDQETSIKGTLMDLITLGKQVKCTYSSDQNGYKVSGTSYISGKNVRGDFTIIDQTGQTVDSHMIVKDDWFYSWSSATPTGLKMKTTSTEQSKDLSSDSGGALQALRDNFDYKCLPWIGGDSTFELPSDITFTDYSSMMEKLNTNNQACAACDYITDESNKASCKEQLKCE